MTISEKEKIINYHKNGKSIKEIMDLINWREIKNRCGCKDKSDVKEWIELFIESLWKN